MRQNPPRRDWFFPIEEAPVLATVTHKGVVRDVRVPNKKALIAADTGDIVGIVGAGYKVFTNQQAVTLDSLAQTFHIAERVVADPQAVAGKSGIHCVRSERERGAHHFHRPRGREQFRRVHAVQYTRGRMPCKPMAAHEPAKPCQFHCMARTSLRTIFTNSGGARFFAARRV